MNMIMKLKLGMIPEIVMNNSLKTNPTALYEAANDAGSAAGDAVVPTPMVVGTAKGLLDDAIDKSKPMYFVEDGVCGFATVIVKPARGKFVKFCKDNNLGYKWYYGGYAIPVRGYGQSLTKKEAYARAFAGVLNKAGVNCYVDSRMD